MTHVIDGNACHEVADCIVRAWWTRPATKSVKAEVVADVDALYERFPLYE